MFQLQTVGNLTLIITLPNGFRFNLGGGAEILTLGSNLADYSWHKVR